MSKTNLLPPQLVGTHLKPDTPYEASIDAASPAGGGVNIGVSAQTTDANGHVVFVLSDTLYRAIAHTGEPCEVTLWIRDAGTAQDAPPAHGTSKQTITVV